MKFDMHCHTREGSVDAKVGIESYIRQLMEKALTACWLPTITPMMAIDGLGTAALLQH